MDLVCLRNAAYNAGLLITISCPYNPNQQDRQIAISSSSSLQRPSPLAAKELPHSFTKFFLIFPFPVIGNVFSTPSSPHQNTYRGTFCLANRSLTQDRTSSVLGLFVFAFCSRNAPTTSPYRSSLMPTTTAE